MNAGPEVARDASCPSMPRIYGFAPLFRISRGCEAHHKRLWAESQRSVWSGRTLGSWHRSHGSARRGHAWPGAKP